MDEDEEEDGAFVMYAGLLYGAPASYSYTKFCRGNFADALGDDFLGLRELGIADEFGMSNLSVPKKLLKGKNKGESKLSATACVLAWYHKLHYRFIHLLPVTSNSVQLNEPPLPYPPPPPFIPLDSKTLDHQIGLLKPYYQERLSMLSANAPRPSDPLLFSFANPSTAGTNQASPTDTKLPVVLPDDTPNPVHVKIGPLGQITRGPLGGTSKKKAKGKDPAAPAGYVPSAVPLTEPTLSGGLSTVSSDGKKNGGGGKQVKGEQKLSPAISASV